MDAVNQAPEASRCACHAGRTGAKNVALTALLEERPQARMVMH